MNPRRIAVFGGAFDPPHLGHQALLRAALAQLPLDELRIVPTGQAWHKPRALSPARHRCQMATLAFVDALADPRVQVDARETRRPGPSYTAQTLRELRAEQPLAQYSLILGQDQAQALHTWHDWPAIVEMAELVLAQRPGSPARGPALLAPEVCAHVPGPHVFALDFPPQDLSSSRVRELAAQGRALEALVGEPIARYIEQHHLYQTD